LLSDAAITQSFARLLEFSEPKQFEVSNLMFGDAQEKGQKFLIVLK